MFHTLIWPVFHRFSLFVVKRNCKTLILTKAIDTFSVFAIKLLKFKSNLLALRKSKNYFEIIWNVNILIFRYYLKNISQYAVQVDTTWWYLNCITRAQHFVQWHRFCKLQIMFGGKMLVLFLLMFFVMKKYIFLKERKILISKEC